MKKWIFAMVVVSVLTLLVWMNTGEIRETSKSAHKNLESSTATAFQNEDYKKVVTTNNQFGMDVLKNIGGNADGNTFISPVSLFTALSMVYNGADGETKEEMSKVLHFTGMDANELSRANASLMSLLQRNMEQINLNIANSIWLNNEFHFQTQFAKNTEEYYHAKIEEISMTDLQSPKKINEWANKSTNGKIKEMVEPPLDRDLVAILMNAIYFKGDWKHDFNQNKTRKRTFHLTNGTIKKVSLMELNEKLPYLENEDFQAVSLPYGNGEWSMNVFLPKGNSSLEEFKNRLTLENWERWKTDFADSEGTILLPKFKLEYEINMNATLKRLGMTTAFDSQRSNFSKMVTEKDQIWIDKVKHKTFIEVNEEGAEAAAATSVEMKKESARIGERPFYMELNRPFFLAITEEKT